MQVALRRGQSFRASEHGAWGAAASSPAEEGDDDRTSKERERAVPAAGAFVVTADGNGPGGHDHGHLGQ